MSDLSTPALVALGVLIIVQAVLYVVALVDLARRPVDGVVGSSKWVWLAVILLVSTLGPILYLVVGRSPTLADEGRTAPGPGSVRPEDVVDALYGQGEDVESP